MNNGIYKTYRHKRKIVCYITAYNGIYTVCTGKPSDATCISWKYDNVNEAEITANEFFTNYTNI